MLDYLYIDNIAVIENAKIELFDGFSVLTGETGSGKSIIIDAIYAILGEKTSKELIRTGCNNAVVSACFSALPNAVCNILNDQDISIEDDKIIIQRKLSKEGKNSVFINGQPSTVALIKKIGKLLVNIHGQHDSQQLLDANNHLKFLDDFIGENKEYKEYQIAFDNLKNISKELNSILINQDEKLKRIDLLEFKIEELQNSKIEIGEIVRLKNEIIKLKNAEKIVNSLIKSKILLNGDDNSSFSVKENLEESIKVLNKISNLINPELEEILINAEALISNVVDEIDINLESLNYSNEILTEKQSRLDFLNNIISKYGGTEKSALEYLEEAKKELSKIKIDEKRQIELELELIKAENLLIEKGNNLTFKRQSFAKKLESKIKEELKFLDFLNTKFIIKIEKGRYTKTGCDDVEFLISANAGEEPRPLIKVASGGELSRIMLALRAVLSIKDDAQTLIFDEIDTGISGFAAGKVGNKLKEISTRFQVICVTHLSQIAAKAKNHYLISKMVKDNKTYTEVALIKDEQRIKEIARIISGDKITENVYNSAKEMLGEKI